jgi:DNA-binding FrmR family transcriptional regulator
MVEADKPCDQVLHQLEAVEAALRAAGCLLIEGQRQASMEVIQTSLNAGERTEALENLVGLYEKRTR